MSDKASEHEAGKKWRSLVGGECRLPIMNFSCRPIMMEVVGLDLGLERSRSN